MIVYHILLFQDSYQSFPNNFLSNRNFLFQSWELLFLFFPSSHTSDWDSWKYKNTTSLHCVVSWHYINALIIDALRNISVLFDSSICI